MNKIKNESKLLEKKKRSKESNVITFFKFMDMRIGQLKECGRIRTSETYITALNSFKKFCKGQDFKIDKIDSELLEKYEGYLSKKGLIPNSISFHMRILRAVFNRAVEEGLTPGRNPFKRVYTGVDKTRKRGLGISVIREINKLEFSEPDERKASYARDIFMMSFFLRGMSFIDMAFLRKTDLKMGVLTYRRRKTGQLLSIGWTEEMQHILDRYPSNATVYLLPIITDPEGDPYAQYRSMQYSVNRQLKKLGKRLCLPVALTAYVARHSWASIANEMGIPIRLISQGLGHGSEATTRIYLTTLDTTSIDKANSLIISSL